MCTVLVYTIDTIDLCLLLFFQLLTAKNKTKHKTQKHKSFCVCQEPSHHSTQTPTEVSNDFHLFPSLWSLPPTPRPPFHSPLPTYFTPRENIKLSCKSETLAVQYHKPSLLQGRPRLFLLNAKAAGLQTGFFPSIVSSPV